MWTVSLSHCSYARGPTHEVGATGQQLRLSWTSLVRHRKVATWNTQHGSDVNFSLHTTVESTSIFTALGVDHRVHQRTGGILGPQHNNNEKSPRSPEIMDPCCN